jgi:O-succinylbenzoate synthase
MKITVARYTLRPREVISARASGREREGALLRFEFADLPGGFGFADCHPWPELGDLDLNQQLANLKTGTLTPLLQRSIFFAGADARARAAGIGLLQGARVPRSHFLLPNISPADLPALLADICDRGFAAVKIKIGRDFNREVERLLQVFFHANQLRLRLDFNALASAVEYLSFMSRLPLDLRAQIEFVEDPVHAAESNWSDVYQQTGVRLAADRELPGNGSYQVRVLKPAIQDVDKLVQAENPQTEFVLTSYLDHPLGQVCSAWVASQFAQADRLLECGLCSQGAYERNAYSEVLGEPTPILPAAEGVGFGFDALLEREKWQAL